MSKYLWHTVQVGETMTSIAWNRCGIEIRNLKDAVEFVKRVRIVQPRRHYWWWQSRRRMQKVRNADILYAGEQLLIEAD